MNPTRRTSPLLYCRSFAFYCGLVLGTIWFGFSALLVLRWLPYASRARYLLGWNRSVLWWLRVTCGVHCRVLGAEHIPDVPVVVLSNHESQWETLFLQVRFHPVATILKRELLNIPGFGWGMRLMKPIAIDRALPREALRQLFREGRARLDEGMNVLVFPQGSRRRDRQRKEFAKGGAGLAVSAGAMVLPVAHDAGRRWPTGRFVKYPGTITVAIGEPIDTRGRRADDVNRQAQQWIEARLADPTPDS